MVFLKPFPQLLSVLQAATIADVLVELLHTLFASHNERLGIEAVAPKFYCFNLHRHYLFSGFPLATDG